MIRFFARIVYFCSKIFMDMAEFKVGDKVNFISAVGGGKVTKIIDTRMVMVEVEDGFEIPTLITDLVLDYRSQPQVSHQQKVVDTVQKEIQAKELLEQERADAARKVLDHINDEKSKFRFEMGNLERHQLRIIPELNFHLDETIDKMERIDTLLSQGN